MRRFVSLIDKPIIEACTTIPLKSKIEDVMPTTQDKIEKTFPVDENQKELTSGFIHFKTPYFEGIPVIDTNKK